MLEGLSQRLSLSQLINLTLATFLLLGIAATTYTVTNLTNIQSQAAKGGNSGGGGGGKGGGKNGGSFTGACSETPNPVSLGGQYTVNGTGFKPNEVLNVNVTNQGMQVLLTSTDSSGNFTVSSYASYTGTYTVFVYDNTTQTYITSCSFTGV